MRLEHGYHSHGLITALIPEAQVLFAKQKSSIYIQSRTTINNDDIITDITITATAVLAITSRTFSHHHTPIIIRFVVFATNLSMMSPHNHSWLLRRHC